MDVPLECDLEGTSDGTEKKKDYPNYYYEQSPSKDLLLFFSLVYQE